MPSGSTDVFTTASSMPACETRLAAAVVVRMDDSIHRHLAAELPTAAHRLGEADGDVADLSSSGLHAAAA